MNGVAEVSARLTRALSLRNPPVGVQFVTSAPSSAARPKQQAPAGCQYWQVGMQGTLFTDARDHQHCAIGIHTHNLQSAPPTQAKELADTLVAMTGLDYVREDEVAAIPVLKQVANGVVYSSLADCTAAPDVVLLFAHAAQGLVLTEALTRVDGTIPAAMGRPACALVPQVSNSQAAAMSLGCCGARAYLDVLSDDTAVWGLPGAKLQAYVEAIEVMAKGNATLTAFHTRRRADIESGDTPSVSESLARL